MAIEKWDRMAVVTAVSDAAAMEAKIREAEAALHKLEQEHGYLLLEAQVHCEHEYPAGVDFRRLASRICISCGAIDSYIPYLQEQWNHIQLHDGPNGNENFELVHDHNRPVKRRT